MSDTIDNAPSTEPAAPPMPAQASGFSGTKGGDDLDSLLAEYVEGNAPSQSSPDDAALSLAAEANRIEFERGLLESDRNSHATQLANEQAAADLKNAVANVRGDLDSKFFDDEFVTTWLDNKARQNVELQNTWLNRDQNPRAFENAVRNLSKEFQKKYAQMPDPQVSADVALVAASVRGSSGYQPADRPANYSRMSDAEARAEIQKQYGFDPGF